MDICKMDFKIAKPIPAKIYAYCRTVQQHALRMQMEAVPVKVTYSDNVDRFTSPFGRRAHAGYIKY